MTVINTREGENLIRRFRRGRRWDTYTKEPIPRGLMSTSARSTAIPQTVLDHPSVMGFLIIADWIDIETSDGVYDWTHIDSEILRAEEAGKRVRLAMHVGGDGTPQWVMDDYPAIQLIYNNVDEDKVWFPAYWDSAYLDLKTRFYEVLGARYKNSPNVFAMSGSMADANTGDWSFRVDDQEQFDAVMDAGFSEQNFINAYKRIIDTCMDAFRGKYVITAVGPLDTFLVDEGVISGKFTAVDEVLEYAFSKYKTRLIIAKGALNATTSDPVVIFDGIEEDPDLLKLWRDIWLYKPQGAAQLVWSFASDGAYKLNGGDSYIEGDIPALFAQIQALSLTYEFPFVEFWKADFSSGDLDTELAAFSAALIG